MDEGSRGDIGRRVQRIAFAAGGIPRKESRLMAGQHDGKSVVDAVIVGPKDCGPVVTGEVIRIPAHDGGGIDPERNGKAAVERGQPIVESVVSRWRPGDDGFPAVELQRASARNPSPAKQELPGVRP